MHSRPERVGEEIREELSGILAREVKDPAIGFVTLTHVRMSADLQVARVYYTTMGDDRARRETARALARCAPFMRRHIAARVRLRRVPELHFTYDESVARGQRIEQLLQDIRSAPGPEPSTPGDPTGSSHVPGAAGERGQAGPPDSPALDHDDYDRDDV
jgi:ribosome-binding factor A